MHTTADKCWSINLFYHCVHSAVKFKRLNDQIYLKHDEKIVKIIILSFTFRNLTLNVGSIPFSAF